MSRSDLCYAPICVYPEQVYGPGLWRYHIHVAPGRWIKENYVCLTCSEPPVKFIDETPHFVFTGRWILPFGKVSY